jgi:hypothetical protein
VDRQVFQGVEDVEQPTGTGRVVGAGIAAVACLALGWFPFVHGTRVPLLGYVDLGFHELGHMLTMWAPRLIYFAMGSVNQIAVPLGLATYFFWLRGDRIGGSLCLAWAGTSAADVSAYIADAPYQRLPLLGGMHDWAFILGPAHLNMLDAAHTIAAVVKVFGLLCVLAGAAVCCWTAVDAYRTSRPEPSPRPAMKATDRDAVGMWR